MILSIFLYDSHKILYISYTNTYFVLFSKIIVKILNDFSIVFMESL